MAIRAKCSSTRRSPSNLNCIIQQRGRPPFGNRPLLFWVTNGVLASHNLQLQNRRKCCGDKKQISGRIRRYRLKYRRLEMVGAEGCKLERHCVRPSAQIIFRPEREGTCGPRKHKHVYLRPKAASAPCNGRGGGIRTPDPLLPKQIRPFIELCRNQWEISAFD